MSETMEIVFSLLKPRAEGPLTEAVIDALKQLLAGRPIDEIGQMPAWRVASEIVNRDETHVFPADADPVAVAAALRQFMVTAQFISETPAPSAVPASIEVKLAGGPETMNAQELLSKLANDPSLADELVPYIERLDLVHKAALKTPNWAITDANDQLDVSATLDYLKHLAKTYSIPRRAVNGRHPMPLTRAIGQEERALINPFALLPGGNANEIFITGPIFDDYDLGNLPEVRHLAYIWAVVTKHEALPPTLDKYTEIPAAFAEPLTGRWAHIVTDYEAAKTGNDPSTEGISRYAAPALLQLAGRAPGTAAAEAHDDNWYRAKLYEIAEPAIQTGSSNIWRGESDIITSVQTGSGDVELSDTLVLGTIRAGSGDTSGTALGAPGCSQQTGSGDQNLRIRRMSWQGLYEEAQKRGLL